MSTMFRAISCAVCGVAVFAATFAGSVNRVQAFEVLGIGEAFLLGNDLTDRDNVHDETFYTPPTDFGGFDAEFFASDKASFTDHEAAFNVFDNLVDGGGQAKWCCGSAFPQIVGAKLEQPYVLSHFTVTSGNDSPERRPRVWSMEGSNDGSTWVTIFAQNDPNAPIWDQNDQVIKFTGGIDYGVPSAYSQFRLVTEATGSTTGAFFQLSEIELFGTPGGATKLGDVNGDGSVNLLDFDVIRGNFFQSVTGGTGAGDINGDGAVNFIDYRIWKDNSTGAVAATASVPEPATWAMLTVLGTILLGRARRSN
ncbi:MAG: dockerin type I domain-containing protein [Pirellulaceae bacterium]|nr:discoidin domain-containing protein [Planctomycetales bacterium]